jgi:hypothetical protein
VVTCIARKWGCGVRETKWEKTKVKRRNLRWLESSWEGKSTTAQEEIQKEEVLAVSRELVNESRSEGKVREYVPWQPLW